MDASGGFIPYVRPAVCVCVCCASTGVAMRTLFLTTVTCLPRPRACLVVLNEQRNVKPRTRAQRRQMADKETLEKSRLREVRARACATLLSGIG